MTWASAVPVCAAVKYKRAGAYRKVHSSCSLSYVYRLMVFAMCGGGSGLVAQLTIDSPEGSSCRAPRVGGTLVWWWLGCEW
jgi:hypothetical protein